MNNYKIIKTHLFKRFLNKYSKSITFNKFKIWIKKIKIPFQNLNLNIHNKIIHC